MSAILKYRKHVMLLGILFCAACSVKGDASLGKNSTKQRLTIFAAASLVEAFTQLGETFEASQPNVEVVISFAGSQQIAQQLSQGAPGDLFASANELQMKNVINSGRVRESSAREFVHNRLVLIVPGENPGNITLFEDITNPGLKLILADDSVPVGAYSQQMLERATLQQHLGKDFKSIVMENVVSYEENVRSVLTKIVLGEADAGIVYVSDAAGIPSSDLRVILIPDEINVAASYYIAPLIDSSNAELAEEFIAMVLSPTGQEILGSHGFGRIDEHE